jgi:hypothetical protein
MENDSQENGYIAIWHYHLRRAFCSPFPLCSACHFTKCRFGESHFADCRVTIVGTGMGKRYIIVIQIVSVNDLDRKKKNLNYSKLGSPVLR